MFALGKFSLIILTRCNLRCRLCCEYIPQNNPFPDMTPEQEKKILQAFFQVSDHVDTLHLTGGGEPFLHPHLPEMVEAAMQYQDQFDTLMLFTNSTVPVSDRLRDVLRKYKDRILVQASQYGKMPEREAQVQKILQGSGVRCKFEKYYGEDQSFGGWVDFGHWEPYGRTESELESIFRECSVTRVLKGNWRTRDGRVHWCSRSQRGMELGYLPDTPEDYVDLMDETVSVEEKREKFRQIADTTHLKACDHCTGEFGTNDPRKRYPAAEQME